MEHNKRRMLFYNPFFPSITCSIAPAIPRTTQLLPRALLPLIISCVRSGILNFEFSQYKSDVKSYKIKRFDINLEILFPRTNSSRLFSSKLQVKIHLSKYTHHTQYDVTECTHTRKQSIIIWNSQLRLIGIKYLHSDETWGKRWNTA